LSKDLQFIVSQAKENPPQDVEEAKTLLALARMDREMRKLEAQHADLAVSMNQAWTKYNSLRAAKAHKMVGTAESTVGRVRSIISKSGFSYPERVSILARPPTAPEEPSNRQPPGACHIHIY
jgi:hypothetical protein